MKRSADQIISSINPVKSAKKYDTNWDNFISFSNLPVDERPNEEHFLQYFDHLKNTKKLSSSTLWSIYSMTNHHYQLKFGQKLQMFPRLTMLLKSFEAGYSRKSAAIFTKEEIKQFLSTAPDEGEFVHMKAGIVLAYCGGLRCADLVGLQSSDMDFNETTGMWVSYKVSKQKGQEVVNKFNVPLQYCQYLQRYDHKLAESNAAEGRAMKTFRKTKEGMYKSTLHSKVIFNCMLFLVSTDSYRKQYLLYFNLLLFLFRRWLLHKATHGDTYPEAVHCQNGDIPQTEEPRDVHRSRYAPVCSKHVGRSRGLDISNDQALQLEE